MNQPYNNDSGRVMVFFNEDAVVLKTVPRPLSKDDELTTF